MRVLFDDDVTARFSMADAVAAVESAFRAQVAGELVAPPRHVVAFPPYGDLIFTIGGAAGAIGRAGFRVYDRFAGGDKDQLVAVWDCAAGQLAGLLVGMRIGKLRMGAIGGLATRHLARADAATVAVIGSGEQARCQLEGAAAVRRLRAGRVYSRSEESRRIFAKEMAALLGFPVTAVDSARSAVTDADIVITATTSKTPIIRADCLAPGTHVSMIGPKTVLGHEIDPDVAERAGVVATDAMEQLLASEPPFFLTDTPGMFRMLDLAELVAGGVSGRSSEEEITLFCSGGLAGTEVIVAAAALERCGR